TDADVMAALAAFCDRHLGKGVVIAKDTPNFIANRIGLFGVMCILEMLASGAYTVEDIDAITGPAIGRPKSATLRTIDIAGPDILVHVSRNRRERRGVESGGGSGASRVSCGRTPWQLPAVIEDMASRGWVGEKAGQGFYRRERGRGREGDSEILSLDIASMTYRARQTPKLS